MSINFGSCELCKKWPQRPEEAKPAWAAYAGWDGCVRWHHDDEDAPPVPDQFHRLTVSFPFRSAVEESFWCLWLPSAADENGCDQYPELLRQIRIVEVRLQDTISAEESRMREKTATVSVEVLRSQTCFELLLLPRAEKASSPHTEWLHTVRPVSQSHELCFAELNVEGDTGLWAVWANSDSDRHVLLEGEWGPHESYFFAGHLVL